MPAHVVAALIAVAALGGTMWVYASAVPSTHARGDMVRVVHRAMPSLETVNILEREGCK